MHSARISVGRSALIGNMFCVTYFVMPYCRLTFVSQSGISVRYLNQITNDSTINKTNYILASTSYSNIIVLNQRETVSCWFRYTAQLDTGTRSSLD